MDLFNNLTTQDLVWLIPFLIWTLSWKGVALWKSGRNNQLYWFIVLLILNTVGILEILYLAFFQKKTTAVLSGSRRKAKK